MSAPLRPARGYSDAVRAMGTPRSIEHRVFARITARLQKAAGGSADFPSLAAGLHENLVLWTAIMADIADSRNALPPSLKAQLLYLGEFTRMHTQRVLRGEAEAEPLIEINMAIMRGLRGQATP